MTQFEIMTSTDWSGSGIASMVPFEELDVGRPRFALIFARQRQHVVGHVQPVDFAGRSDSLR